MKSLLAEWKIRQFAYHVANSIENLPDNLNNHEVVIVSREELYDSIIHHFETLPEKFIYPSKSYVVAIVYSKLLSDYFGGNFFDYLNDPELLYNNDPYFVPYNEDKELYDKVLLAIGTIDLSKGTPCHIVPYFNKEFLIDSLGAKL